MIFKEIESINGDLRWSQFYLNLGRIYGKYILTEPQIHNTFLKIPYTDYIPHIIALGIADSVYDSNTIIENIDLKSILQKGMTVYHRSKPELAEDPYIFIDFNDKGYPIIADMKENTTTISLGKDWIKKIRIANEQVIYKKGRSLDESLFNNLKNYYSDDQLNNIAQSNMLKVLIIGNETRLKAEAEAEIQELPIYNWLLLKQYLHPQLFSLCNIYSSKYKGEIEELTDKTIVIYTNLESFLLFHEELKCYSSIILFSPIEEQNAPLDALTIISDSLDDYKNSELIEESLIKTLPKGVDIATWIID